MITRSFFPLLFLIFASFAFPTLAYAESFTIYLTRHAEKVKSEDRNPDLTEDGKRKANTLATQLANLDIEAIYSTDYLRTQNTAAPLADRTKLPVVSYDPGKLKDFATELLEKKQTALVVGHSNTTPMLTYLISGKYQRDIDESDYSQYFAVTIDGDQKTVKSIPYSPIRVNIKPISLSQTKLHSFDSSFNMLFNGEVVGTANQKIVVDGEEITFSESTKIEKFNIDAEISAVANKNNLAPSQMSMTGKMGAATNIRLTWTNTDDNPKSARLIGQSLMARSPYKEQGKIAVDREIQTSIVERTTAIMSVPFYAKRIPQFFQWYNGYDDDIRTIKMQIVGEEKVTVPAGEFHTQKVKLEGGAPSQYYFITKEEKPKVVKIEVIGMPWSYELTNSK